MAERTVWIVLGVLILGIVLLAVGWVIEPNSNVTRSGTGIVDNVGVALIALGLTFIIVGLGYFLAWMAERAMASGMM